MRTVTTYQNFSTGRWVIAAGGGACDKRVGMIHYLVTHAHRYTMDRYLESRSWDPAQALDRRIRVVPYHTLPASGELPTGAYIFADLERLTDAERAVAAHVWEQLQRAGEGIRLLNHPQRALSRYDLLRALHQTGINQFRAYRLDEAGSPRFPVFVRYEHRHEGSITPLLHTQDELDRAIAEAPIQDDDRRHLLVVEFCDTADQNGVYRKYGAFLIGDRVIPRGLMFDRHWVVKEFALIDDDKLREQDEYMNTNPHEEWIREVFRVARIDYGRLDYALLDGRPQAWEINTNPNIMRAVSRYPGRHQMAPTLSAPRIAAAFASIDPGDGIGPSVPVTVQGSIRGPGRPGIRWAARRVGWTIRKIKKRRRKVER